MTNKISIGALSILAGLIIAMSAAPAAAQCRQWNAAGQWQLQQSNGYVLSMVLSQNGKVISGKASYGTVTQGTKILGILVAGGDPAIRTYDVTGNVEGDDFYLMIGTAGIYRGKVSPSGRIDGTTYDQNRPSSQASWFSTRAMICPAPPAPKPKPAPASAPASTGNSSTTKSSPAPAPAPPPTPPFIIAGQPIIQPYLPQASVYLGWDAGAKNPKAQVWVSVNNAPEVRGILLYGSAFEQPKIPGFELKLQRGMVYKYLLKDGKKILSTVVVAVP